MGNGGIGGIGGGIGGDIGGLESIIGDYWDYYAVKVAQCCKDAL